MTQDWTQLYKKYKGLWIALLDDEKTVVGSGKTAAEAMKKAAAVGSHSPILTRIPDNLAAFVG